MVQDSELPKIIIYIQKKNLDNKENEKIIPADSTKIDTTTVNEQSINANKKDTEIQESAQDTKNTKLIDEYEMIQDSEFPKNNNLNAQTNTNLDDKENENILPKDSNSTVTVTAND